MNLSENNIVPISTNDKSYVNSCEVKDKTKEKKKKQKKKINNKNCCILILLHELGILAFSIAYLSKVRWKKIKAYHLTHENFLF